MNKLISLLATAALLPVLSGCSGTNFSDSSYGSSGGSTSGDGFSDESAAVDEGESEDIVEQVDTRDPVLAAVEDTIRANCTNLPSDATVEGPTTFQEFLDPPRANIFYVASGGNSDLYFWAYYLDGSSTSLTTAYAGEEELAAQFGCPVDMNPR
jgi:hypothetical protein